MTGAIAILLAYLLGAVPFAWLVSRARGIDLRAHGSGNLGATNAIRVLGARLGVPVLVADVAKGLLAATVLPRLAAPEPGAVALACGAAAVLGHVYPVYLRFRGGKGVATAAGAFLGLAPGALAAAAGVFAAVLLAGRYVSLASVSAALALPLVLFGTGAPVELGAAAALVGAVVIVRHRANLARLSAGREHRVRLPGLGRGRR